jgi:hypothetical protein
MFPGDSRDGPRNPQDLVQLLGNYILDFRGELKYL